MIFCYSIIDPFGSIFLAEIFFWGWNRKVHLIRLSDRPLFVDYDSALFLISGVPKMSKFTYLWGKKRCIEAWSN